MAMMRVFPLESVPKHEGSAVIRAPFLLAPTLVTRLLRSITLLTSRILKRCTFSICPEVLCIIVKVLGRTLLRALFPLRCRPNLVAPLAKVLLDSPRILLLSRPTLIILG